MDFLRVTILSDRYDMKYGFVWAVLNKLLSTLRGNWKRCNSFRIQTYKLQYVMGLPWWNLNEDTEEAQEEKTNF